MKYDAIVIGSGIAGITFARAYNKYGKKVAIVEKSKLGGTAISTGCLPVKVHKDNLLDFLKSRKIVKSYGVDLNINLNDVYKRGREKILGLQACIEDELEGIDLYFGDGEFLDRNTFKVGEEHLLSEIFVLATGTSPVILKDCKRAISHKELINLENLPEELLIVGGGVEAVEIADIYSSYGVKIDIVFREVDILQDSDIDLKDSLVERLRTKNVNFYCEDDIIDALEDGDKIKAITAKGNIIKADYLLYTSIRKLNKINGLEDLGIIYDENKIHVDNNLKTSVENIYTIGDVNGMLGMAHVAYNQGLSLAKYLCTGKEINKNYSSLPRSIFTLQEISGIGKSENDLKTENYKVSKVNLRNLYRGYAKELDGFAKLIYRDNELLGYWIVSDNSSDLMADSALWFDGGCTLEKISQSLFINPSLLEVLPELYLKSIKGDE